MPAHGRYMKLESSSEAEDWILLARMWQKAAALLFGSIHPSIASLSRTRSSPPFLIPFITATYIHLSSLFLPQISPRPEIVYAIAFPSPLC
jgi:hypothetical protein